MSNFVWEGSAWYKIADNKPLIVLIGRDVDTNEIRKFGIKNFDPYFYAPDPNGEAISCFGDHITKIVCNTPDEVPKLRAKYEKTFEADILFDMRYTIDRGIFYGFNERLEPVDIPMHSPRVCYFDIEVASPNEIMPSTSTVEWPIVMIQCLDSYTNKIDIFTLGGEQVDESQHVCGSESALLQAFGNHIASTDPDIVTGWYSEGFDIPYIMRRARKLKHYITGLSRLDKLPASEDRWPGRTKIDLLQYFKDWSKPIGQQSSFDLKAVCSQKRFGDFKYVDYGDRIQDLIDTEDWTTLVEYGKNDVIALQKIDKKTGLIDFYENLRKLVGIKFEDTLTRTKIIETFLMRRGIKPVPTRVHRDTVSDYKGALVLQPTPGIKKNVGVTDLKSLYPSIIIAYDISPDIDHTIPKVIVELISVRDEMRRLKYEGKASEALKTSEQSLKYIINAFYGYLAFNGARLYKPELAGFITEKGREISLDLHSKIKALGYTIEYGDTDSTFISVIISPEQGIELQNTLNDHLGKWAADQGIKPEHAPVLKFEKLYSKLLFKKASGSDEAAKKRYAGVLTWKDGNYVHDDDGNITQELDYTGLEIRRSDTSRLTKKLMETFFDLVLIRDEPYKAIKLVNDELKQVQLGQVDVQDIAIPKGVHTVKTETAWVRGMRNGTQLLGIRFREDKKPRLIYCVHPVDVICIDDDTTDDAVRDVVEVNWKKTAEVNITKKMKSLVESLGYDWDQVIHGQRTFDDL